jgi:hypothetical protein
LYLYRLLSAKLLQVAHHLSLIDYLSLSLHPFKPHPSMNMQEFVSLTYIGKVIRLLDLESATHTVVVWNNCAPFKYMSAQSLKTVVLYWLSPN